MGELMYFSDVLSEKEKRKTLPVLEKAVNKFEQGEWALVGSLAVHYWLTTYGQEPISRRNSEIDLVTLSLDSMPPDSQEDFAFAHVHQASKKEGHYAAFVARKTGLLVNAFAPRMQRDRMPAYAEVPLMPESDLIIPVIDPIEQAIALIDDAATRVEDERSFGSHDKFFTSISALRRILLTDDLELSWDYLKDPKHKLDALTTIDHAQRQADMHIPISRTKHVLDLLT